MGMTADYKIAIEEGSNMIRVGSLIFGKNPLISLKGAYDSCNFKRLELV